MKWKAGIHTEVTKELRASQRNFDEVPNLSNLLVEASDCAIRVGEQCRFYSLGFSNLTGIVSDAMHYIKGISTFSFELLPSSRIVTKVSHPMVHNFGVDSRASSSRLEANSLRSSWGGLLEL